MLQTLLELLTPRHQKNQAPRQLLPHPRRRAGVKDRARLSFLTRRHAHGRRVSHAVSQQVCHPEGELAPLLTTLMVYSAGATTPLYYYL